MKKYKLIIKGVQPIIWNVMKRELELEKKELKKDQLGEWETDRKNWIRKCEFNDEGKPVIPERWIKNCLIDSCKRNRLVPHFATRKNETYTNYVTNFLVFNKSKPFHDKDIVDYSAFVGAQGKNSTTKVWRVRPMLKKWESEFEIIDPAERMKISELTEIIEYAGLMIGLGDNRINNFGRFEIVKLEEIKDGKKTRKTNK